MHKSSSIHTSNAKRSMDPTDRDMHIKVIKFAKSQKTKQAKNKYQSRIYYESKKLLDGNEDDFIVCKVNVRYRKCGR